MTNNETEHNFLETEISETSGEPASEDIRQNTSPIPVLPQLSVALGLLFLVFGVTYIGASKALIHPEGLEKLSTVPPLPETKQVPSNVLVFQDTALSAKSAFVWDVKNQRVLFNKNGDDQLPLASIAKLMTALVAYELLDSEETVTITQKAIRVEGDSGFVDGEQFTVHNLLNLTLMESSNDGAAALSAQTGSKIYDTADAETVFVQAMNIKAEELGLSHTYFNNSTGLDISESEAGAYGSARDVALLMEYIIKHSADAVALTTTDITTVNNNNGEYHLVKNTNEAVNDIAGLIASKTGYTQLSGGNLAVAVNIGLDRPVVIVVLGSSREGRFSDTLELIRRTGVYIGQE